MDVPIGQPLTTEQRQARDVSMWVQIQWPDEKAKQFLFNLMSRIERLESQKSPETPGSESTSRVSDGASPETTTPSSASRNPQPESATTEDSSSVIRLGRQLAEAATPLTRARLSKTQEPTRFTSEMVPATGRSASIGEWQNYYSADVGHYVCRNFNSDSPPDPCFYFATIEDAIELTYLLNRATLISLSSSSASAGGESEE